MKFPFFQPQSGKASLISRMARMGQPMLPLAGAVPAGPESDSDLPASPTEPRPTKHRKPAKVGHDGNMDIYLIYGSADNNK